MSRQRIGIDCRLAGSQHAGIGRYIVELVQRLTTHTDVEWVLFFFSQSQVEEMFGNSIPKQVSVIISPVQHYTLAEQLSMTRIFAAQRLDLLHVPHFNVPLFYSGKLVITIHDLLWHERKGIEVTTLPAWQYWLKYVFYRLVTRSAVSKAQSIFVPTHTVQHTLARYYPHTKNKIVVTPEGVGSNLLQHVAKVQHLKRDAHQLLYVGSLYPHKNVRLVLEALRTLKDYTFIIVGSRTVFRKDLEKLVKELHLVDRVSFVGKVSDEELAKLYAQSLALVQPSFSEGFGLTGLEALAFTTPVIASDIPVFREVYQDAAVYFDPYSTEQFCEAVEKVVQLPTKIHEQRSRQVSALYNWESLAEMTYHQYQAVLARQ